MTARKLAPHERPMHHDTDSDARRALVRVYQLMPPERKATRVAELWQLTKGLFEAGYKERHPTATPEELIDAWLRHTLDADSYEKARSYRHELARRRLERSAEGCPSARGDEDSLRARGFARELGAGSAKVNQ